MIQAPNGRVYRRNRAHLKPICHDGSTFPDHLVKKGKKQPKDNSFQDHQTSQARSVSFDNEVSYLDTRSMMFDEPETHQAPPTSPLHSPPVSSPPRRHSPRSPSCSPPASFPSSHPLSLALRTPHPKAGRDTSLNQLSSNPKMLTKDSHVGLSALLAEMSPLAPYRLQ